MPATEKTWRDQKWMHVVFGVSSLIMLISTVWMLEKDHNREWRRWQMKDRGKERWQHASRLAETSAQSHAALKGLKRQLAEASSSKIDQALIQQVKDVIQAEDARLAEEGTPPKSSAASLTTIEKQLADLEPLADEAAAARAAVVAAKKSAHDAVNTKLAAENDSAQRDALPKLTQDSKARLHELQQKVQERDKAEQNAGRVRKQLLTAMNKIIGEAKRREDAFTVQKKFVSADHTARVSEHGIAVGEGLPTEQIAKIQAEIDSLAQKMTDLDDQVGNAKDYRVRVETVRREIEKDTTKIEKELGAVQAELNRIADNRDKNSWNFGEWLARRPILNALYDGNIRIEQTWLPDIKINYNFSEVPRYDRCITCHRSIDKTAPGSAVEPAFPTLKDKQRQRVVELATPSKEPEIAVSDEGVVQVPTLESVYGLTIAGSGQVDHYAVTVQYVTPKSLAAAAGLQLGDIIREINGGRVYSDDDVEQYLLDNAHWGESLELTIRRGLGNPYTSHPRLDLYVGSMSPHKKNDMGCTICHDGQGSATDFKWASHTPDNAKEAHEWSQNYGWFDNHHWIFPMTPDRFIESNCLKCHHEVAELEPSERFPEPPAPKLVKGYHLIRQYGCFGCHDVNGYDGPTKRIGPDMRLEPNYHEVAAAVLRDNGLTDDERESATTLVHSPEANSIRHELYQAIRRDADLAEAGNADGQPRLSAASHKLADLLKDVETPGRLRKAGPSLRYIASKVQYPWLYSWIRKPSDFRPSTRMPQFFGLHEHLEKHIKAFPDGQGNPAGLTDLEYTRRFERIEILALARFLLNNSSKFDYLSPPAEVTTQPSPERGKWLFESRGCLACHSHREFPGIASTQGPNLSEVSAKFDSESGRRWLYSWIKQPHRYHPRTVMPDLYLNPIVETDPTGEPTGVVTDPVADLVGYLMSVPSDWKPHDVPAETLTTDEKLALKDLAAEWLAASFPRKRAERYANEGIPAAQAANIKGDERVLVDLNDENRVAKQLDYVARRSISRYGCFGCHDIPGQEAAKPIGTALTEWGRKEPSKLAFENIAKFLSTHGVDDVTEQLAEQAGEDHAGEDHASDAAHASDTHAGNGHHGVDPLDYDDDTGYYLQAVSGHHRQGFIWQKLRQPRSYDYEKTRNKRYDERLRMPLFPLDIEEREAVITFVLGLVNEAPAEKFVYRPDIRQEAIVQGRHVLHKYNCGGCHVLDMERWQFGIEPDWFEEPPIKPEFPFLQSEPSGEEIAKSLELDHRGLLNVTLHGMPVMSEETGQPNRVDEDGVPIEADDDESEPFYEFTLYRNAVVAGYERQVGVQNLLIPAAPSGGGPKNGREFPANGGDLARYLFPRVIAQEHKSNPQAKGSEAWGWLPPPLIGEGTKVRTEWLHGFLMDPSPIRPAVVLRMPNFHMSSDEASALVNYFAAKDNADWPYEYSERRRDAYLTQLDEAHPEWMDNAVKIVTDGNYCVKCHAVGDFFPKGAIKTQGPQLANVYQRLRPTFVRSWIASPSHILPYTGMPVNIPFDPNAPHLGGVNQALFPGTSVDQLDGLVDLLMNYDDYTARQTTIKSMVKEAPPPEGGEQAAEAPEPRPDQSASDLPAPALR